jgi:hypothetical protein
VKPAAWRIFGVFAISGATGCRTEDVFRELDPSWNRMQSQPRYDDYGVSRFFADGKTMRDPPEGTIPYSDGPAKAPGLEGMVSGVHVSSFPLPVTRASLELGRSRFEVICAACHGLSGDGDSVVANYMPRRPPSLHELRILMLPNGRIYEVVRDGYGLMPAYRNHLTVEERWAVVAYVRALERSRHAVVARLPGPIAAALVRAVQ